MITPILLSLYLQAAPKVQPTEPQRSGEELCLEVEYELNESVRLGYLIKEEADRITKRCFKIFA